MVGEGEAVKIKKKAGGSPGAVDTPTDSLQQRKGKGVCVEGGGDGDPSRVAACGSGIVWHCPPQERRMARRADRQRTTAQARAGARRGQENVCGVTKRKE